jgi:hypothetical protein
MFWLLAFWLVPIRTFAEPLPALRKVPHCLPVETQSKLNKEREPLAAELTAFLADAGVFNAKQAKDQSDAEYDALSIRRAQYTLKANAFNSEVDEELKKIATESGYTCVGNGLIGGTDWIVYASRGLGEPEKRMCDAIKHQAMVERMDYDFSVDCKQYQFVLGMASSLDFFTDLKIRVAFDDLNNGRFSAQEQLLYEKLRGKWFDVLGCHSNGAMICLAALVEKKIKAENVVLYGPQITRESLEMWDKLVRDHEVKSVKVYINENDPVPGASIAYADQFQVQRTGANAIPKNPSVNDAVGVAVKSAVVAVNETINVAWSNPATKALMDFPLFQIDALKRTINETSPRLLVQSFPCGNDLPTGDCHVLSMYRSTVGCTGKSSGQAVQGTALNGKDALPEPPLPCGALGGKL